MLRPVYVEITDEEYEIFYEELRYREEICTFFDSLCFNDKNSYWILAKDVNWYGKFRRPFYFINWEEFVGRSEDDLNDPTPLVITKEGALKDE